MISYLPLSYLTSHAGHLDELPRRGHRSDRHFDQRRHVAPLERPPKREAQLLRIARALGPGAEALGVKHEIRIAEIACDHPVAVLLLLDPPHIAEGAVVEHDDCERDVVAHGGGELVRGEEKAAVARDRYHRH